MPVRPRVHTSIRLFVAVIPTTTQLHTNPFFQSEHVAGNVTRSEAPCIDGASSTSSHRAPSGNQDMRQDRRRSRLEEPGRVRSEAAHLGTIINQP